MQALDFVREKLENRLLLQKQLVKDFAVLSAEFPADFSEKVYDWSDISNLLQAEVVKIMEKGESQLLQVLYTIDLPEQKFLRLIGSATFLNDLVQAIIMREAEKVYFKKKFSS